jgi:ubiquinone/menaquinone biosynthesis C-methylase UbiE
MAMYLTSDMIDQRKHLIEMIQPHPGDRVLDVGSGPGFLAAEIGEVVGSSGQVCGLDISETLLSISKARSAHQPWVEFRYGDAARLPFPNNSFDIGISTQVLEYVPDVNAVLIELYRVLRPGGRVVLLDTDWDSIVWHSTDNVRMNRILSVWEEHTADAHLPRTLSAKLLLAGFQIESQQVIPMFNPIFDHNTFSNRLIDLIVSFVSNRKGILSAEADAWAAELRQLGERGEYFFSLNRYLFIASKP